MVAGRCAGRRRRRLSRAGRQTIRPCHAVGQRDDKSLRRDEIGRARNALASSRMNSGCFSRKHFTISWFSSGSMVQVLYTRTPPGFTINARILDNLGLDRGQFADVRDIPFPLDVRLLRKDAQSGTGGIQKHLVGGLDAHRRGIGSHEGDVAKAETFDRRSGSGSAFPSYLSTAIDLPLVSHHLRDIRGLSSRGRAQVDHPLPGARVRATGTGSAALSSWTVKRPFRNASIWPMRDRPRARTNCSRNRDGDACTCICCSSLRKLGPVGLQLVDTEREVGTFVVRREQRRGLFDRRIDPPSVSPSRADASRRRPCTGPGLPPDRDTGSLRCCG